VDQRQSPEFLPKDYAMPSDCYLVNAILHTVMLADNGESATAAKLLDEQTAVRYQPRPRVQPA